MSESVTNSLTANDEISHPSGARVAVLLPLPLAGAYDYLVPDGLIVTDGDVVRVPFGKRELFGVIWRRGHGQVAQEKLKAVVARCDVPPMGRIMREFIDWVARYTVHAPGAVLKMALSVPAALEPPKQVTAYGPGTVPDGMRMTPARARVLEEATNGPPRIATELARAAACGPAVVKGLADAGALTLQPLAQEPHYRQPDPDRVGPALSAGQQEAALPLSEQAASGGFKVTLLDGVPGAGKTEVYFEAIAGALKAGRQVLVLLPEIALSAQWRSRFRARFGGDPVEWHSDLTPSQRRSYWRGIATGQARVVVGARSALFLPFQELGVIVVDEEHDGAFKQEEGVTYNARDMAVVRARLSDIPVVLASATPSLETVTNAKAGRYGLLHLPDRHAGAVLPDIQTIDMRAAPPPRGRWLSPKLASEIETALANGEQAMLFLNRRGYAPLTLCRKCGHRFQCPRCTSWLVEHRFGKGARLQCHHCGFGTRLPDACPSCEAEDSFAACGPGVERLAEELHETYPDARIEIAASDTIAGPKAAEELIRRIEQHEIDLVVGTQIVAKGYHFPMLTLVGVIDADLGLSGGDLRAAERTYQILYQVAGRAGRAKRPGRVVLQTFMPDHPVMKALVSGERDRFLAAESEQRRLAGMPPFGRLAALIVSGENESLVDGAAKSLGFAAPNVDGIQVWGPAPAPFALLRGKHRRRLLLKARKDVSIQGLIQDWISGADIPKQVRVQIDVDPYSFL